eukprot:CAMPEP_0197037942 /NCGR_PEP_ID=MMETSP1384-20130603/15020_1 /TAXON_ID=29189 /ORGANISM="Ammonia sp." /LENGTH=552 /DNA_ID=CAMNT_0042468325 /DNA_START=94 /DNA_END=1752 /DNA_ORIENTATION=-
MAQLPDEENTNQSLMDDIKVANNYNMMDELPESKHHDELDDFNDNDSLKNNADITDFEDVHHVMIQERDNAAPSPPPTSTLTARSLQNFDTQNPPQSMLVESTKLVENTSSQPGNFDITNIMNDFAGAGGANNIPDFMIDPLVDMGFSREKALYALRVTSTDFPSVELACQWLFDHPDFEPQDTSNIAATISNMLGSNFEPPLHANSPNKQNGHNPLPPNNSPDHNAAASGGLVGIPSSSDGFTKPTIDDQHKDDNFLYGLIDNFAKDSAVKSKSSRVYPHNPTLGSAATESHLDEEKHTQPTSNHTETKVDDENGHSHKQPVIESKNDEDEFSAPLPIGSQIQHQTSTSNVTSEISTLSTGLRSQSPSIHNNNATNTSKATQNGGNSTKEQLSQLYQQQHQMDAMNRNNVTADMIPQDLKMVLVVRKDLKMTSGKVAAQCCHACLGVVMDILDLKYGGNVHNNGNNGRAAYDLRLILRLWRMSGEKKIVLQCKNEQKLMELRQQAVIHNLPHYLVSDAGHTQIAAGSKTVLAIGPYPSVDIDEVTKELKLY